MNHHESNTWIFFFFNLQGLAGHLTRSLQALADKVIDYSNKYQEKNTPEDVSHHVLNRRWEQWSPEEGGLTIVYWRPATPEQMQLLVR